MIQRPASRTAVSRFFCQFTVTIVFAIANSYAADETQPKVASAVTRGAEPAWIEAQAWEPVAKSPAGRYGAVIILSDSQDRLTSAGSDYYYHLVLDLKNAEGVRQNAEWSVVYSPEYEKVTWHKLRLIRNGQSIDRLPAAQFKSLQRELGLEAQLYTGLITAATVLDDVRVGDILEVSYTLHSDNPLLRGHMTARHALGAGYPIDRQVVIARSPADTVAPTWSFFSPIGTQNLPGALFRPAALRSAMEKETSGSFNTLRWEGKLLPAIQFDDTVPVSLSPYFPLLRGETFTTWASVVDWAEPLFASSGPLPDSAREMVVKWKKEFKSPDDRLNAAVKWVQEDVRYFAMAMGDHNLRPRKLVEICDSRFGDCKDKAVLLSALLRELDIEAWPALVNTYWRDRIQEYGPGAYAFNHAIVAYVWNRKLRWVDATLKEQGGPAGAWAVPLYRWALILRRDEAELTPVSNGAAPPQPDTITRDVITVDAATGDASMATETTVYGLQADYYRQQLQTMTPEAMSKNWFNYIARFYKKLQEVDAPSFDDDRLGNRILIRARYRIPEFVTTEDGVRELASYAYGIRSHLEPPESRRRLWPYAIEADRFLRHRIEIELPFTLSPDQQPQVITADGIEYRVEKGLIGTHFVAVHDLRITRDFVAADRMNQFCEAVDEIAYALSTSLKTAPESPKGNVTAAKP